MIYPAEKNNRFVLRKLNSCTMIEYIDYDGMEEYFTHAVKYG